jgi:hypothetical protein
MTKEIKYKKCIIKQATCTTDVRVYRGKKYYYRSRYVYGISGVVEKNYAKRPFLTTVQQCKGYIIENLKLNEIDDRWSIELNQKLGYISILDHKEEKGIFLQDESAKVMIDKVVKLGANNTFIKWFYHNGYDLVMNETTYHNK